MPQSMDKNNNGWPVYVEDKIWHSQKYQQFREADADGFVGMRGYMDYFQDAAGGYMHEHNWGNDTIHELYGVGWVYTKYRMHMYRRTDYTTPLSLSCWIKADKHVAVIHHELEIREGVELLAEGRLESCLVDMTSRRITKLEAINYDRSLGVVKENHTPDFSRIETRADGLEKVYEHTVRYSDMDNNRHMTNLRYIPLLEDAFDPDWYDAHELRDLEIHYRNQCLYGEKLNIYKGQELVLPDASPEEENWRVVICKEDGTTAACGRLGFVKK